MLPFNQCFGYNNNMTVTILCSIQTQCMNTVTEMTANLNPSPNKVDTRNVVDAREKMLLVMFRITAIVAT